MHQHISADTRSATSTIVSNNISCACGTAKPGIRRGAPARGSGCAPGSGAFGCGRLSPGSATTTWHPADRRPCPSHRQALLHPAETAAGTNRRFRQELRSGCDSRSTFVTGICRRYSGSRTTAAHTTTAGLLLRRGVRYTVHLARVTQPNAAPGSQQVPAAEQVLSRHLPPCR